MEHPIFELFILLKWARVHHLFKLSFFFLLFHILSILALVLVRFSDMQPSTKEFLLTPSFYTFIVTNTFLSLTQVSKSFCLVGKILRCYSSIPSYSLAEDQAMLYDLALLLQNSLTPVLGWLLLALPSRTLAAAIVLYSNWHLLMNLTMFPMFVGMNTYMTAKVMRTVLGYFLAYFPLIFAFSIAFHLLLPNSRAFG